MASSASSATSVDPFISNWALQQFNSSQVQRTVTIGSSSIRPVEVPKDRLLGDSMAYIVFACDLVKESIQESYESNDNKSQIDAIVKYKNKLFEIYKTAEPDLGFIDRADVIEYIETLGDLCEELVEASENPSWKSNKKTGTDAKAEIMRDDLLEQDRVVKEYIPKIYKIVQAYQMRETVDRVLLKQFKGKEQIQEARDHLFRMLKSANKIAQSYIGALYKSCDEALKQPPSSPRSPQTPRKKSLSLDGSYKVKIAALVDKYWRYAQIDLARESLNSDKDLKRAMERLQKRWFNADPLVMEEVCDEDPTRTEAQFNTFSDLCREFLQDWQKIEQMKSVRTEVQTPRGGKEPIAVTAKKVQDKYTDSIGALIKEYINPSRKATIWERAKELLSPRSKSKSP